MMTKSRALGVIEKRMCNLEIYDSVSQYALLFASHVVDINDNPESIVLFKSSIESIKDDICYDGSYIDILKPLLHPDVDFLFLEYLLVWDEDSHPISSKEMEQAEKEGFLYNPFIDDFMNHYLEFVAPTFRITKEFENLIKDC